MRERGAFVRNAGTKGEPLSLGLAAARSRSPTCPFAKPSASLIRPFEESRAFLLPKPSCTQVYRRTFMQAAKVQAKAQKEAEKAARKKEREEKAALKQTNIKSFFVTKKGGAKPASRKGGANTAADKGGPETGAKGGAQKPTADQGGGELTAKATSASFPAPGNSIRTNLFPAQTADWLGSNDGVPFRTSVKRSEMSLRGGDGSVPEDDAGPFDRIDQRRQSDAFSDADSAHEHPERSRRGRGSVGQGECRRPIPKLDADASLDAPVLGTDASPDAPQPGADASSDALPGASERRYFSLLKELPESPFTKHPERAAGFEKLADLRRRLAALDAESGGVTSAGVRLTAAEVGVTSAGGLDAGGADWSDWRREKGKEKLRERSEGDRFGEVSGSDSDGGNLADNVRRRKGAKKANGGRDRSPVGLLGTRAMPVEIDDSPPRPSREATRGSEPDRPTTPARRNPSEGFPGQGSPVTPSKRRAEECPVEHTPPKRLADQFDRVRGGEGEGEAAIGRYSAKRLMFEGGLSGDVSARRFVTSAEQDAGSEGNERRRKKDEKQGLRGMHRTKGVDLEDPHQAKLEGFVRGKAEASERDNGEFSSAAMLSDPAVGIDTHPKHDSRNEVGAQEKVDVKRPSVRTAELKGKRSVEVIDLASDDEDADVAGRMIPGSGRGNGSPGDVGPGRVGKIGAGSAKQEPPAQSGVPARKARREVLEIRKRSAR